jgi:hypothetical protein
MAHGTRLATGLEGAGGGPQHINMPPLTCSSVPVM